MLIHYFEYSMKINWTLHKWIKSIGLYRFEWPHPPFFSLIYIIHTPRIPTYNEMHCDKTYVLCYQFCNVENIIIKMDLHFLNINHTILLDLINYTVWLYNNSQSVCVFVIKSTHAQRQKERRRRKENGKIEVITYAIILGQESANQI